MSSVREASVEFLRAGQEAMAAMAGRDLSVADMRRLSDALTEPVWRAHSEPGPDVDSVWDVAIAVCGAPDVRARLYRPPAVDDAKPSMHLHVHGGGWWQGSIDQWIVDVQARERAVLGNAIVVSVDYSKAPEAKFPAGLDDVTAALEWSAANAAGLGASDRLTVSGVSAGANLIAAAMLRNRDRHGPVVDHQILEATPVDLRVTEPTAWVASEDAGDATEFAALVDYYLEDPTDAASPLVSPLLADDLSGLPATTLFIGTRDPFLDGGRAFADRLRAAGVNVSLREFENFLHHTPALTAAIPAARQWRAAVAAIIRGEDA